MKHEIHIPRFGKVVVVAPTQSGKSIILSRIEKVLREEFGCQTLSKTLDAGERENLANIRDWEREMVKGTVWELEEINLA